MHGQAHNFPIKDTFIRVLGPPIESGFQTQDMMMLAICEYKAPNGIIYIARQGMFPGVNEMITLWPELEAMFKINEPTTTKEKCPECNRYMSMNLQHMTHSCHFCGLVWTDQALYYLKIEKVKKEWAEGPLNPNKQVGKTAHQKKVAENLLALQKEYNELAQQTAEKLKNEKKLDHSSGLAADSVFDDHLKYLYSTQNDPWAVEIEFSYYDKAYDAEFKDVELDPTLWDRDNDAGLL